MTVGVGISQLPPQAGFPVSGCQPGKGGPLSLVSLWGGGSLGTPILGMGVPLPVPRFSRRDSDKFRHSVDESWSAGSRWRQWRAMTDLAMLVGNRFGTPLFGKDFVRSNALWKWWWAKNKDRLVWDESLRRFVTQEEYEVSTFTRK